MLRPAARVLLALSVAAITPAAPADADRTRLSPEDLARKNERGYFTGLPLANFDPSTGFGGGARGYYYFNGDRDDERFSRTPYLHRVFLQLFTTSKGLQFHWLDYDAPTFASSPFRLRAQLIYVRNTSQHFFGVGSDSLGPLSFSGDSRTFDSFDDYTDAIRAIQPDGTTYARYDQFDMKRPISLVGVERTFLDGRLRPLIGLGFNHTTIDDYAGEEVETEIDGDEVTAEQASTRLAEACAADVLNGCDGGWENYLRLGISFDTRDFEPDPNRGLFADAMAEIGTSALGSDFDFARFLVAVRGYYSPIPRLADLVVAARLTGVWHSRGAAFYSLSVLPFTEDPKSGLGGIRTLRGFKQDRFIGRALTLFNTELRWTFTRFALWKQQFALIAAAFVDQGRVYDHLGQLTLADWQRGYGGALRISWNLATIVAVDYGVSDEDSGLYINFGHQF